MNNEDFIKELDNIIQDISKQIIETIVIGKDVAIVTDISFFVEDKRSKDLLVKYGLKAESFDIKMSISTNKYVGSKVIYYYNKCEVKPKSHYILPNKSREVTLLEILKECQNQDTSSPDIKSLQVKE